MQTGLSGGSSLLACGRIGDHSAGRWLFCNQGNCQASVIDRTRASLRSHTHAWILPPLFPAGPGIPALYSSCGSRAAVRGPGSMSVVSRRVHRVFPYPSNSKHVRVPMTPIQSDYELTTRCSNRLLRQRTTASWSSAPSRASGSTIPGGRANPWATNWELRKVIVDGT